MNNLAWTKLITAIHASERATVLAVTGGGSSAISQLLQVPGGSRSVLEAVVPYSSAAQADWLGSAADQACSSSTARAMAMAAWMRARKLAPEADPHQLIGVGATASLVSDRPKRGEHRVHVATQTASTTATFSLTFAKGQRERVAEEALTAELILLALAEACRVEIAAARNAIEQQLYDGEELDLDHKHAKAEWTELLLGVRSHVGYRMVSEPQALLSGSFNPPHEGHKRIVALAAERLGSLVAYELSITNVDKPSLDFVEIDARLKQLQTFDDPLPILLTDAPTFCKKSELYPGCTFIVGADTMARIANPKYYRSAEGSFDAAIEQIADRECRFLVFGREIDGEFCVLSDLELLPPLRELCDEVSAEEFREDVSSTELRSAARLSACLRVSTRQMLKGTPSAHT